MSHNDALSIAPFGLLAGCLRTMCPAWLVYRGSVLGSISSVLAANVVCEVLECINRDTSESTWRSMCARVFVCGSGATCTVKFACSGNVMHAWTSCNQQMYDRPFLFINTAHMNTFFPVHRFLPTALPVDSVLYVELLVCPGAHL